MENFAGHPVYAAQVRRARVIDRLGEASDHAVVRIADLHDRTVALNGRKSQRHRNYGGHHRHLCLPFHATEALRRETFQEACQTG